MCQHDSRHRKLLTKQEFGPEEERAFQWWLENYRENLQPVEDDIETWLNTASEQDLSSLESIRGELEQRIGNYTNEFEVLFREGGEEAAQAGRALAGRRYNLDIAFDMVPSRTLDELDDWVETAAGSTLETITEDATRWLRGAHEEGLSIDDISDVINEELFEGRLEDHVAERAARTGTISTSNAGSHSAFQDAEGVVGEEWLAEIDGRTRDSHAEADGQIVPVNNSFQVGDVYLEHPGDPSGAIGEIVNCRCTIVPVFADDLSEEELAALEAGERLKLAEDQTVKLLADGTTEPLAA